MIKTFATTMGLTAIMTLTAFADPISGKDAKKVLYAPLKAEVEILKSAGLGKNDAKALQMVGVAQPYFGAIAISPEDGLMSESTVAAANYHDTEAASAVALAECNAKKKGKADCVLAALIRPKGWKDRGFQMSSDATQGFKKSYDAKAGAMAISKSTGGWGLGKGATAPDDAVAACIAKANSAKDCAVVIAN